MGLFDIFSREKEFHMIEEEKPFYYTLGQYQEYFADERAGYDDMMSFSFQLESNPVHLAAGTGCWESLPSVNGSRPMFDFYCTYGTGIRYGQFMDTLSSLADEYGWDSPFAFNCFYSDYFISPGYMIVEKDPEIPAHYIISGETWTDTGQRWFNTSGPGLLAL